MEFADVLAHRRMVRRFDPDRPVGEESLRRVLAAAVRAPNAGFSQGWDFVVLTDRSDRERFWSVTAPPGPSNPWLDGVSRAPALVVCCSHPQAYLERYARPDKGWTDRSLDRWPIPYWDVDTGMAALLALLTAVDEGLGGLFFGVPPQAHDAVRRALDIPGDRRLVGVVALGHPAGRAGRPLGGARRGLEKVIHDGRFGAGAPAWARRGG